MATTIKKSLDSVFTPEQQIEIRDNYNSISDPIEKEKYYKALLNVMNKTITENKARQPIDTGIPTGPNPAEITQRITSRQLKAIDRIGADGSVYNTFVDNDGQAYFGNGTPVPSELLQNSKVKQYESIPKPQQQVKPESQIPAPLPTNVPVIGSNINPVDKLTTQYPQTRTPYQTDQTISKKNQDILAVMDSALKNQ